MAGVAAGLGSAWLTVKVAAAPLWLRMLEELAQVKAVGGALCKVCGCLWQIDFKFS